MANADLEEMINCLSNPLPQIRELACKYIQAQTVAEESLGKVYKDDRVLPALKALAVGEAEAARVPACLSLANMCAIPSVLALAGGDADFVKALLDSVLSEKAGLAARSSAALLLTNMSTCNRTLQALAKEPVRLRALWDVFTQDPLLFPEGAVPDFSAALPESDRRDALCWTGYILMNLCQLEEVRKEILGALLPALSRLARMVNHACTTRRVAALGFIKNCLIDTKTHASLSSDDAAIIHNLFQALMDERFAFDEEDLTGMPEVCRVRTGQVLISPPSCAETTLEALLLLCSSFQQRQQLRDLKLYPVMRELDKVLDESQERMKDLVLSLVDMLIRDEDPARVAAK